MVLAMLTGAGNARIRELAEARPPREWRVGTTLASPTTALRVAAPGQEATELESALERESRKAASEHGAVVPQC